MPSLALIMSTRPRKVADCSVARAISAMIEELLERTCGIVPWPVAATADDPALSSAATTSPTDDRRVAFAMSLASLPTEAGKARENWQRA
jgi:hypothetical protein